MAFVTDTFTETSDTAIAAHVPDSGGTITQHPNFANGGTVIAAEDRARGNSTTASSYWYYSATPASADYTVEGTGRVTAADSTSLPGIASRMSTTATTWLSLHISAVDNTLFLLEVNNGSISEQVTYATSFSLNTDYVLKLEVIGTGTNGAKGYLNGILRTQLTPNVVTAAGKAGVRLRQNGRIDNYSAFTEVPSFRPAWALQQSGIIGAM